MKKQKPVVNIHGVSGVWGLCVRVADALEEHRGPKTANRFLTRFFLVVHDDQATAQLLESVVKIEDTKPKKQPRKRFFKGIEKANHNPDPWMNPELFADIDDYEGKGW